MNESMILTIDVGTSSMRAILYDPLGKSAFYKQINYTPNYMEKNLVEMNPFIFRDSLISLVSEAVKYSKQNKIEITALSITSQRSSVIPLDKNGYPLYNTIMWQDKRCDELCKELEIYTDSIYRISGLLITSVFSAIKMRWFMLNEPEIYKNTYKMVGIHDYLLYIMMNDFVTDRCLASRTNLLDLNKLEWSDEAVEIFGISKEKLCRLVNPGDSVGESSIDFHKMTGLPIGTKIISAGGDQQCAALGVGTIRHDQIEVNIGTGGYIIGNSKKPTFDKDMKVFCNVSAIPGQYIIEGSVLTSGLVYRWMNEKFYKGNEDYNEMNQEVLHSPLGANNLILLPYFKGRGTPQWNPEAKGVFYNVGMETTKGDFARAVLESIAFEIEDNVKFIELYTGKLQEISCCGGLMKFNHFVNILSDVTEKRCVRYNNSEATSLGALISATVTLGIYKSYEEAFENINKNNGRQDYEPNLENTRLYKSIKEEKEAIYKKLFVGNTVY